METVEKILENSIITNTQRQQDRAIL